MDKVTTFFNKCETSGMNQLVKAVFKIGLCSLDLQLLLKNVHRRKWKKRKRPDTDQLERCRSDRAGSADRGVFVTVDTEGGEKRQAKQDGRRKSVRRSFQASSLETATSTRATGAASEHRQHRLQPPTVQSGLRTPASPRESF